MSDPAVYTVGWICALLVEYIAARALLDEEHEKPSSISRNDTNTYTLGEMGEHYVVIAVLPDGEYGTASAANVATNMLNTFYNIKIGLMVGVGGGVPSKDHDIRLGDVVVSAPREGESGVFQYDLGKSIQGRRFQQTRFLNQPPTILRTAITGLQAKYKMEGYRLDDITNRILEKNPRIRSEYKRPTRSTDRLFKAEMVHETECSGGICVDDLSKLKQRITRDHFDNRPVVHYGLIASGNQLMKDALIRDRLAEDKGVLCFEMEAAGLMNTFPCLVIRGICDYSDSHKSKDWQGYASMVAAAYTKDLLSFIHPHRVQDEKRIGDVLLTGFQDIARLTQKQLEIQERSARQVLFEKEQECLQLFRLFSGTEDVTYEWYKHQVDTRIEGTCEWFLSHEDFQKWLQGEYGLLLVSADPGCGKSVLAKYLIDEMLSRLTDGMLRPTIICYFFFKDQNQNTIRQALCAILHQVFCQSPSSIKHAMDELAKNGRGLINSNQSLWKILRRVAQDPQLESDSMVIILDALDECPESELDELVRGLKTHLYSDNSNQSQKRLKFLMTTRPYQAILGRFTVSLKQFPYVHIPGDDNSEMISQEINHVIRYRIKQLAREKHLSELVKQHLEKKLLAIPHRTYLWIHLIFNFLRNESFKKTPNGVDFAINSLPKSAYGVYERILNKTRKQAQVRRILRIILAANRPLTISEMNVALSFDGTIQSFHNLDLERDADFGLRLRDWCGFFVSIYQDKVYLLHQTAREFLLCHTASPEVSPSSLNQWQSSITTQSAHNVLAEICVLYLDSLNHPTATDSEDWDFLEETSSAKYILLDYSAKNWATHCLEACISSDSSIAISISRICNPISTSWTSWFNLCLEDMYSVSSPETSKRFMSSSYFGLDEVIRVLLMTQTRLELLEEKYSWSPLSWAAINGHANIVETMLRTGRVNINSKDNDGRTLLSWAAGRGHSRIVEMLSATDNADVDTKDAWGRSPLSWASAHGHADVAQKLLSTGKVDVNPSDMDGRAPLSWASAHGHRDVAQKLLNTGKVDLNSRDKDQRTPLSWAAAHGHTHIVEMLIATGNVDVNAKGRSGRSPLSWASAHNHKDVVQKLLDTGKVDVNSRDADNRTPLSWAASHGHDHIVGMLLATGKVDIDSKDVNDLNALSWAKQNHYENVVQILSNIRH
ncbi:hypothetical protein N7456_013615 [Penicillium angulare]|uniref:NACHT domain-containing protein n=1 Tax=Penicillium angulare TaxID=116970 RepID=A0A9W9EFT0_9EURO|nr:hypothetical protein N7456_013615 [Penicillium angulare]